MMQDGPTKCSPHWALAKLSIPYGSVKSVASRHTIFINNEGVSKSVINDTTECVRASHCKADSGKDRNEKRVLTLEIVYVHLVNDTLLEQAEVSMG